MKERPATFAHRLGVHKSTVTRAIQAGRLTLENGVLDVEASLLAWQNSQSGARPDVAARHAAARGAQGAQSGQDGAAMASAGQAAEMPPAAQEMAAGIAFEAFEGEQAAPVAMPAGMQRYTAARIEAQNNLVKLGIQLRTHQRYPLADVRAEALALGGALRAALERVVDQTAPQLAMLTDPVARRALLDSQARGLRRDMQRELPRALRRLRAGTSSKP